MIKARTQSSADVRLGFPRRYASPEDFCAIFEQDMNALYSLALLLTGEPKTAEKCFVAALEECRTRNEVFSEFARSWSKRAIVTQAIRLLHPQPGDTDTAQKTVSELGGLGNTFRGLLRLGPFERFVFAMELLERYSSSECALLLGCHRRDVEQARLRSLQFISTMNSDPLAVLAESAQTPELLTA